VPKGRTPTVGAPNTNVTCYTYDALHRSLNTAYTGPNATANRYYVYDAATVNGKAMTNALGRLAEGYTESSPGGTNVTDEGFAYSPRGQLANFYESTPHSAGYYSLPMTYWANGQLETFGPFLTEPQVSITPDGEGRPYTIIGSSSNVRSSHLWCALCILLHRDDEVASSIVGICICGPITCLRIALSAVTPRPCCRSGSHLANRGQPSERRMNDE
jgi:hypothetical protein